MALSVEDITPIGNFNVFVFNPYIGSDLWSNEYRSVIPYAHGTSGYFWNISEPITLDTHAINSSGRGKLQAQEVLIKLHEFLIQKKWEAVKIIALGRTNAKTGIQEWENSLEENLLARYNVFIKAAFPEEFYESMIF